MKALAVYPNNRQFRVIADHPEPKIEAPDQIKLRMIEVGVCGTDKEIVAFEYGDPPPGSDYLVIGHESLGEVVEAGSEVVDLKKGDLVVLSVRRPCDHPECLACREGRQDFCYTGDFTERGIKGRHGYMTEYVVESARYANKAPADLKDVAVLVEPLTIAEKGIRQLWEIQQRLPWASPLNPEKGKPGGQGWRHKGLVLGAGPVGLLGAMKMVLEGMDTYIYSRVQSNPVREEIAKEIGAKFIAAEEVDVPGMAKAIGNIDVVYEAVGASKLAYEVMPHLGINGVFIFTGVPGRKAPMPVDTSELMRDHVLKNQVVFGTVNAGPDAFRRAIEDLGEFKRRWPKAVQSVISNRVPIEQAPDVLAGKVEGIKNVIQLSR